MGEDLTRTPTLTTSGGSRNCRRRKLGTRRVPGGGGGVADRRTCRRPLHNNRQRNGSLRAVGPNRRALVLGLRTRPGTHTKPPTGRIPINPQAHRPKPDTGSGRAARRAVRSQVTPAARTFPDATCHQDYCTLCHLSQKQAHHAEDIHTPRVSMVLPTGDDSRMQEQCG